MAIREVNERSAERDSGNGPVSGVKRVKKTQFGRREMRQVTRTTRREPRRTGKDSAAIDSDSENEDDDDVEGDDDDEDSERRVTTSAAKSNRRGENKSAYSALVTLLKSEHDLDEFSGDVDDENDGDLPSEEESGESDEEQKDEDVEDANDEALDEEDKAQDDMDVLNKYDAFNLHFNDEDAISASVDKFETLPASERRLKMLSKEEITKSANEDEDDGEGDDNDEFKYVKYRYGYPSVTSSDLEQAASTPKSLEQKLKYHNVKKRVQERVLAMEDDMTPVDVSLLDSMLKYETFNLQYMGDEDMKSRYQDYYLLHVLNHLMKTRDRVLNNNEKKYSYEKKMREGSIDKDEEEPEFRDQGYTRPKVLILLPSRNFAYRVITKLISVFQMDNVENKRKFKQQFYDDSKIRDRVYQARDKDFEEFFDGNTNDMFVLGMKYTRKTLKLYSPLEHSDIIVASPIGLMKLYDKIGNGGGDSNKRDAKGNLKAKGKQDGMKNNFLSSIEITILDKAEGMMMQNWDNVTTILNKHLNQTPKDFMDVDFSRVRMWAINGQSEYVTQLMTFAKFNTPEMTAVVKRSKNLLAGCSTYIAMENTSVVDKTNYSMYQMGVINRQERLKQVFTRFDVDMSIITQEPDKRLEFFKNVILPQILNKSSYKYGTLIYIPSYFDYLRLKKYLKESSGVSFVAIDEYSSNSQITRSRALFQNRSNHAKVMLYTERLHFYKRFEIKGVRNVVFYQLPSDPDFYTQVLGFIAAEKIRVAAENSKLQLKNAAKDAEDDSEAEEEDQEEDVDMGLCMVRAVYSRLDAMRCAPIVGHEQVGTLMAGDNEVTEFR